MTKKEVCHHLGLKVRRGWWKTVRWVYKWNKIVLWWREKESIYFKDNEATNPKVKSDIRAISPYIMAFWLLQWLNSLSISLVYALRNSVFISIK
jgi:hypothetical protein